MCRNDAGLVTTKTIMVKLDKSAPDATIFIVGGTKGLNDWYISDVTAFAYGSDDISGPVTCTPMLQPLAVETINTTLSAVCTNLAGISSTPTIDVKIDRTPPLTTIAASAPPNGTNGWYTVDPTLITSCDEAVSTPPNWNPPYGTAPQVISTETAGLVVTGTCTNLAGLSSSDTEVDQARQDRAHRC